MDNNNQEQKQQRVNSETKKEPTNSGGNSDTPPTSSSKPKDIIHDDVCSICFEDVSMLNCKKFTICTNCGKVMHLKCNNQLHATKCLSEETKKSCPMCRAKDVARGSKELIKRLQRWTQRGKAWAQFMLGGMYSFGYGVNKNPKRASELYTLASNQGHAWAQYNLGNSYDQGDVIQSDTLAFKFYKLSADQGVAVAQYHVGIAYSDGAGVEQSVTEAFRFYELAANQGNRVAQFNLGIMYDQGEGEGVIQSDATSFKYHKLSADQDYTEAQNSVGVAYAKGRGVEQSLTKARDWCIKAAKKGHKGAIDNLKIIDELSLTIHNLCSYCNKPAQTDQTLKNCPCNNGAQYCNRTCYQAHWKEHKAEHNRFVKLLPSIGETKEEATDTLCSRTMVYTYDMADAYTEDKKKTTDENKSKNKSKTKKQKPNERCSCGSKKKYKKCCGSRKKR